VAFSIIWAGGTGVAECDYTGATSGRVGRATAQGDPNVTNAPTGINRPATLTSGAASFVFRFNRLTPSESGTVYMDGVSLGAASTDTTGRGLFTVTTPPTAMGIHALLFVGSTGDVAVAPLNVIPAACTLE